jgi:hypothetical protein
MLFFTPILMRGDSDPLQIAIVVLFLIGSFIKWLWENRQAKQASQANHDPEGDHLRDDTRRRGGPPPMTPAAPSPFDEWRRALKELQEAATPAAPPPPVRRAATQPPLQQPAQPAVRKSAERPVPVVAPAAVVVETKPEVSALHVSRPATTSALVSLRQLRGDPALMRQAILMHEILGPPKALQTAADPAI